MRVEIFTVFGKPMGKQRPRFSGHAYTPMETVEYENLIGEAWGDREPLHGCVAITIRAYMSIPKRLSKKERKALPGTYAPKKPDNDNIEKIVFDALMRCGAIDDDACVVSNRTEKRYDETPRIEVIASEVE